MDSNPYCNVMGLYWGEVRIVFKISVIISLSCISFFNKEKQKLVISSKTDIYIPV